MSATKHTPGPWRLVTRGNQCGVRTAIVAGPRGEITRFDTPTTSRWQTAPGLSDEKLANARLIAAAPALVEVSELAEQLPELNPSNYDHERVCEMNARVIEVILAARAALAAATGAA